MGKLVYFPGALVHGSVMRLRNYFSLLLILLAFAACQPSKALSSIVAKKAPDLKVGDEIFLCWRNVSSLQHGQGELTCDVSVTAGKASWDAMAGALTEVNIWKALTQKHKAPIQVAVREYVETQDITGSIDADHSHVLVDGSLKKTNDFQPDATVDYTHSVMQLEDHRKVIVLDLVL